MRTISIFSPEPHVMFTCLSHILSIYMKGVSARKLPTVLFPFSRSFSPWRRLFLAFETIVDTDILRFSPYIVLWLPTQIVWRVCLLQSSSSHSHGYVACDGCHYIVHAPLKRHFCVAHFAGRQRMVRCV